ncbi:Putative Protein phosphatase [Rhizopus microsporus]|nr:Putative Protein phosphatase [Rhizopus microsporus]
MVVVLDDRSDVWSYSPNLVRIKPYEYFVGTGDINNPARIKEEKKQEVTPDATIGTSKKAEAVESEETTEKADDEYANITAPPTTATTDTPATTTNEDKSNESRNGNTNNNVKEHKEEDPSIYDDEDVELYTMLNILKEIHRQFYKNPDKADVTKIIPSMKSKVLENCVVSFAPDVIPVYLKDPTLSWIWQMATSFGATCSTDLTGKTTHLIAVKWDSKVKAAKEYGHSKIVTPAWLLDSTARWKKQDEEMYALPDAELSDIENPDSVSLEDNLFDEKEEELIENVDWDEISKEVDDFMNESGIDDDGDTTDSESTTHTLTIKEDR